jgi:GAF domain-containing protein
MEGSKKTKKELVSELKTLRTRVAELERSESECRRAEVQVIRQGTILNAINEVFREALTCETEESVSSTCLAVAEELTGSKFGFIGELNQAGLFDTLAISNPGWEACKMPGSEAARWTKNMEIRGIDRSVLREEKSRIVNDPASHPDRVGTPEGHPPITCFLGVPLKHAGRTIGMIGLANKESGYDPADQQAVETLSVAFVEALMRKRAEAELREKVEELERFRKATVQRELSMKELKIKLRELEKQKGKRVKKGDRG